MKTAAEGKNAVIIGSGIGGLSTGIILSLLNYKVTVVEKNPLPGGLVRSYRRSGIDCPVGVHYVGALGKAEPLGRIFRFLGIDVSDVFRQTGTSGIIDRYIFDKFTFELPCGIDAYGKKLLAFFPEERDAVTAIIKTLRDISAMMLTPSFLISPSDPFRNMDYLIPLGEYLRGINASDNLQAVVAVPSQLIGVPADRCPVIFHFMVLAGYLFSSWELRENGARMADIFADRLAELGGNLILNNGAGGILFDQGRVSGLRLQSGDFLSADIVIAAIHPKALLDILDAEALKTSYRQRIADLQETDGVLAVCVKSDDVREEDSPNIYRLHEGTGCTIKSGVFYHQYRDRERRMNLLSIITKSLYGEWGEWEGTSSGMRGRAYEEKKTGIARELLREALEIIGDLRNPEILDVFTPLTLRDYVNCPAGSCYGVMHSADQLLKIASLGKVPLAGLYLAGQNIVAPGVLGTILGSLKAAKQIAGAERLARELESTWE